jgi:hypothetical protein
MRGVQAPAQPEYSQADCYDGLQVLPCMSVLCTNTQTMATAATPQHKANLQAVTPAVPAAHAQ